MAKKEEKILEKSTRRYCLAVIQDQYCWYLRSLGQEKGFELVTDIEAATKTATASVALVLRQAYEKGFVGNNAPQLVIIPVITDYSLVKEIED